MSLRRVSGIEGALVDNEAREITALDPSDPRTFTLAVAGPAALLASKLVKIEERTGHRREEAKDGHDAYRLLREIPTDELAAGFELMAAADVSRELASASLARLDSLFGEPESQGAQLAAATVVGVVEDPGEAAEAASVLAGDLVVALGWLRAGEPPSTRQNPARAGDQNGGS